MRLLLFVLCAGAALAEGNEVHPFQRFDERLNHYYYRTYSWQRLTLLGADTGIDYLTGGKSDWGHGAAGYGSRYGFNLGRRVVQNSLELGLSAAFKDDNRFRESGTKGLRRRTWHAVVHAFTGVSPEGKTQFSWSRLLATAGATAITSGWQPRPVTGALLLGNLSSGMMSHVQNSLLTEFSPDMKRFGIKLRKRIFRN